MTKLIPWTRRAVRPSRPATGFPSILGDVDRLIEDMWRQIGEAPAVTDRREFAFAPSLDVRDADGVVEITADLPGLSEQDFEVTAENGVLTIRGERHGEREQEKAGRRWTERTYGRFERSVRLPEGADFTAAEASYAKGVLTVKVPKAEDASKAVKIAVQTS
jgi:HSP20 family protein